MNKKERTEEETIVKTTKTWKTEAVHIGMLNISKENCVEIMTRDIPFKCEIAMEKNKKSIEKNMRFYPVYFPVTTRTSIKIDNYPSTEFELVGDNGRYIDLKLKNEGKSYDTVISVQTKHEEEKLYEDLIIKIYNELVKCLECDEYMANSIFGNKNKLTNYCYDVEPVEEHKESE